jgi:polyisoprenoid-binding protein YceI
MESHRNPAWRNAVPRTRTAHPSVLAALVLATMLAAAPPARAAEQVLVLDPDTSEVTFDVQATGHDVHGHLFLDAGEVRFDPATGAASGRIEIDAARSESGNDSRDKTMRNKVLEVASYPLFVFVPERFEGELPESGKGEVSLVGTLTLHGADHPLTLPATVERDGGRVTATTHFQVPYVEWGMHNPSLLFLRVADEVAVTVTAQGELAPAAGRAAAAELDAAGGGRR